MSEKFALIVSNSIYQDTFLAGLVPPQTYLTELADILRAPDIGDFDHVITLTDETDGRIRLGFEDFFADKKPDDLLLLYFSGHIVRDDQGRLFLTVSNTRIDRLRATGVPAGFITDAMDSCRSKRQILILDCCYSSLVGPGAKALAGENSGSGPVFEGNGYGRVMLTANDAIQYSWKGTRVTGKAQESAFTRYLIEGLKTGVADRNRDGWVTVDELYDYIYEQIAARTPKQTPGKWSYKQQGEIVIAKNSQPTTKVDELPAKSLSTKKRGQRQFTFDRKVSVAWIREVLPSTLLVAANMGICWWLAAAVNQAASTRSSTSLMIFGSFISIFLLFAPIFLVTLVLRSEGLHIRRIHVIALILGWGLSFIVGMVLVVNLVLIIPGMMGVVLSKSYTDAEIFGTMAAELSFASIGVMGGLVTSSVLRRVQSSIPRARIIFGWGLAWAAAYTLRSYLLSGSVSISSALAVNGLTGMIIGLIGTGIMLTQIHRVQRKS